ncbi:hypothetical protein ABIA30_004328 [Mycobacterium sp. MAA66]|uniref:hypothetical protein n=1 Tax=Mycobacterium sp. MAA66 TaxID=3156297 RepID=UPI00351815E6
MADQPADSVALTTYRFLRGGMVVMVVLLGGALVAERWHATCWQTSISAYYFTTAHTVFIGALYAVGAMLIVYQGTSDTENTLLNLAGVLSFVIATVPTTRPILLCSSADPVISTAGPATLYNIWTVAVVLALSRVASWWLFDRAGRTRSPLAGTAIWVQRALLGIGVVILAAAPDWFRANGHGIAAASMFGAIVLTVFNTAFGSPASLCGAGYRRVYQAISIAMAATLIATVAVHLLLDNFNHTVLVVETALIFEFAAYWVVQTIQDNSCTR